MIDIDKILQAFEFGNFQPWAGFGTFADTYSEIQAIFFGPVI